MYNFLSSVLVLFRVKMTSPSRSIKRLRKQSLLKSSGWITRKYQLLLEFLALARANGAIKDPNSRGTKCNISMMPEGHWQTETQKLAALEEKFPTSPHAERLRFLRACKGDLSGTMAKLQAYVDWRDLHGLDLPDYTEGRLVSTSDEQQWLQSCKRAIQYAEKVASESLPKKSSGSANTPKLYALPQIAFAYADENGSPKTSITGRLLLHIIPGRINKKLAPAETYALALSFYLDCKQDRNTLDLFFVMMDVRPGQGWANPPAYTMMPFVKATATLLHQHYPERLDKLFVFPLPRAALWIWEMVKPFLDRSVVESAHLIGGKDSMSLSATQSCPLWLRSPRAIR